jgi:hypothetical protein
MRALRGCRKRHAFDRFALTTLVLFAAAGGGCNDPQAPAPALPGDILGRYASGNLVFELQTAGGGATALALVATSAHDGATHELHANVALHKRRALPVRAPSCTTHSGERRAERRPYAARFLPGGYCSRSI